jgi:SAM-dependent methyltransferase
MAFEDVMSTIWQWTVTGQALAALGAELELVQSGQAAPPEIVDALRGVSLAAGIDTSGLNPQQRAVVIGLVQTSLHESADLVAEPARATGWHFTDPVILDGWGRGSMLVPALIAAVPELQNPTSFLDVGTGVGLLAVAAAGTWPGATIVGIDIWEPSLERARANVAQAGLSDRITLRHQNLTDIDDVDAYDSIWLPSFFMTEDVLAKGLPRLLRALRPGASIAFGLMNVPPSPLAEAMTILRTVRSGGAQLDAKRASELLETAGFADVHEAPSTGAAPVSLVIGTKA